MAWSVFIQCVLLAIYVYIYIYALFIYRCFCIIEYLNMYHMRIPEEEDCKPVISKHVGWLTTYPIHVQGFW